METTMDNREFNLLLEFLSDVDEPRADNKRHNLIDILMISICATIADADGWPDIQMFGDIHHEWFKTFLELPNGIPSHDTFQRVFSILDSKKLNECIIAWISNIHKITHGEIISIDGKTIRNSFDAATGKKALHVVSALAKESGITLGQLRTDKKSNEITAIPKLLDMLAIKGALITIDAMGCQKKIVNAIIDKKADYLIAVKKNQKTLYHDITDAFAFSENNENIIRSSTDYDKGHGRIETRTVETITDMSLVPAAVSWRGVSTVARVISKREINNEAKQAVRYYISSIKGSPEDFGKAIRGHWSIENSLHWVLDVVFNEDKSRTRKDHAPENLAVMRRMAMNLLRTDKGKGSLRGKRKKAGWNRCYLESILWGGQMR
jgi:predicted transposase YbfD/YdcC